MRASHHHVEINTVGDIFSKILSHITDIPVPQAIITMVCIGLVLGSASSHNLELATKIVQTLSVFLGVAFCLGTGMIYDTMSKVERHIVAYGISIIAFIAVSKAFLVKAGWLQLAPDVAIIAIILFLCMLIVQGWVHKDKTDDEKHK
ncbi:MAG: hypothetical protein GQ570_04020 [Helicobacteraceae bacterium]|nr:hypothetical protein [Helicobacteraceae bacterium]